MVKWDLDNKKYFSQIVALKFLGKIFPTLIKVRLDPFPALVPIHNDPNHHGLRTQLFPACTARAKQQFGIFTQLTLCNPGGGLARRGPRLEKTLQVKSRLTRHDVLDSSFDKKNIRRTVTVFKRGKVHNF